MKTFRTATNGTQFRVERCVSSSWFRFIDWLPVGEHGQIDDDIKIFHRYEDACELKERLEEQEKAKTEKNTWRPYEVKHYG